MRHTPHPSAGSRGTPPDAPALSSALSRRRVLVAGTAGLAALAAGGRAAGARSLTPQPAWRPRSSSPVRLDVAMGWIKNVEYGGSWLAIDEGFYEAEGLEVEYLQGGPNAPAPPVSVAAGDGHLGVSASMMALLDAINEGNDFVVVGTQYQTSPGAVLSMADRPVTTPEDLVGTTFLGQEGVDVLVDAVLDVAGLPRDYEFIVAGFTPDPLVEGQGDAYSCFVVNQPITLEQQGLVEGEDFVVTPWADLGLPSYANLFFAERTWLDEHRDTVVAFMRATIKGWELNEADPSVAAALAVETFGADLGLDLAQQTRQNELQIPLMKSELTDAAGLFRIDPEFWDGAMATAYVAAGRETAPAAADVVDLTILDDVFGDAATLL